ncbi:MAG: LysM peptidoglycan-binding domain-containing protein [Gallionella sp.]|nr:LysM peptidoglycan-binding domain-containing protein [Gallionella sp.]
MKLKSSVLMIALCTFNNLAFAEAASADVDYIYQVKKGDNLGKLSREVLDSPARWNEVSRYNKLRNSNLITPGQTLRMQLAWLKNVPAEARVESLTGAVTLNGQAVKVGDAVPTGATLETPAGGSVRLSLPDGSTMNVLESSNVAAKQLDKKEQGNFFRAVFRIVTGRIEVFKKKYPLGQAPLHIQSKNATIGVRGTHFRMGQEGDNTLAEIEDGLVGFEAEKISQHIELAGGQGSVADGKHPLKVITLLPQPKFPNLGADFPPSSVSFIMPALNGATGFSGEVASDEEFRNLVAPVKAQGNLINIAGLSVGHYWLRLRAIDENGLQGMEGKTAISVKVPELQVVTLPENVVLNVPKFEQGEQIMITWQGKASSQYELQISVSDDFKLPLITQASPFGTQLSVPTPMPGHYFMRVRQIEGKRIGEWSNSVDLEVK